MTQDHEKAERAHWRKRQIIEDEAEHQDQRQRTYTRPKERLILTCDQLGICQLKSPKCPDCTGD